MNRTQGVGLPEALERAAEALPEHADAIRPANGDPSQLAATVETSVAARILAWLLEHETEDGAELAEAWAEDLDRGAQALLALTPEGMSKAARKVLRRAHHRLRSRGIQVAVEAPAAVVATLPPVDEAPDTAVLSPVDPSGTRVAYLVESNPAGGVRLFELALDEGRGIVGFEVFSAGRSKVKKFLRDFAGRASFRGVAAPPDALRALVARTLTVQPADRPPPRSFSEWISHVARPPEGAATPGEIARRELADDGDPTGRLARAAELVRNRQLGPWPRHGDVLQGVAAQLAEIRKGQIIVSGLRKREQGERVLEEALASVYAEPHAEQTALRLEESAFVFWRGQREEDARACLAAADAFRAGSPAENPVARALLETLLAPLLDSIDDEEGEGDSPSLLVKP